MTKKLFVIATSFLFILGVLTPLTSMAQTDGGVGQPQIPEAATAPIMPPPPSAPAQTGVDIDMTAMALPVAEQGATAPPVMGAQIDVNLMRSLFFTKWEHDLIIDARRGLNTQIGGGVAGTGPREISLGGIVFVSKKEWTIWLNGMRVTPTAIPAQVMDMKVFREHIDLEWFDDSTNQIFPIRLRPYERFNLDSRIFLPG